MKLLLHFLAALAYRTQKALRDVPPAFGDYRVAEGVRTPRELVRHMTSVLGYARVQIIGGEYTAEPLPDLAAEIERFNQMLEDLGARLEGGETFTLTAEAILQGPFADAMTHAGQLALLRRLAGSPIPAENFMKASITAANLGPDQPAPVSPGRRDGRWDPRGVNPAEE